MPLHKVATLDAIPPGTALRVYVEAREIGLFNVGGTLRAIKNLCPHYGDQLHKGKVVDGAVVCPGHGWRFDLASGACVAGDPQACVRNYRVVVKDNEVFIEA